MRSFRVEGFDIPALVKELAASYANQAWRKWTAGDAETHLLVANRYFLRTSSTATLVTVVHQVSETAAEIFALATGAETGIFGITWGANQAYEADFDRTVKRLAQARGLTLHSPGEEPPPAPARSPEAREQVAEVRCRVCGMRTPRDKGECYYCGSRL